MNRMRLASALFITTALLFGACKDDDGDDDGAPAAAATPARTGPGADATDKRAPELGADPSVVMKAQVTIADAIAQANAPTIEAKFELGDDGKLSLSVYPVKDIAL